MSTSFNRLTRYGGLVNVFLVPEDDGLTVIDTAVGKSAQRIRAAATALGAPIRRIALTHAHGDHVGSLDELADALPGVEVLVSAREARFLAKDMSLDPDEPRDKLRGGWPTVRTRPTATFEPGDAIGSLEVVASPGHTPGHVSFLDRRDGTLYSGDAWSTLGGVATAAKGPLLFPLVSVATWHKPTALRSARTLRALEPARLAPGHGKVVENPGPAMDAALARLR